MLQARPTFSIPGNVGLPENTSIDETTRCYGMPCDQWQRVQRKMVQYRAWAGVADGLPSFNVQVWLRIFRQSVKWSYYIRKLRFLIKQYSNDIGGNRKQWDVIVASLLLLLL